MPKVEVVHASSPLCSWSWGYDAVIDRIEMLYGKQIQITFTEGIPHSDLEQWLKDYDMTEAEALAFDREIQGYHKLPTFMPKSRREIPATAYPAAVACIAARLAHGVHAERKLSRALMFAYFVEKKDTSDQKVLEETIGTVGLDNEKMGAIASTDAIDKELGEDMQRGGHGANFYSILVRDNKGTTVQLEQAYDPSRIERAIDYVAGGKLVKSKVKPDVAAYARENGPVALLEVQRLFALDAPRAKKLLAAAERKGDLDKRAYPGIGTFWAPVL